MNISIESEELLNEAINDTDIFGESFHYNIRVFERKYKKNKKMFIFLLTVYIIEYIIKP